MTSGTEDGSVSIDLIPFLKIMAGVYALTLLSEIKIFPFLIFSENVPWCLCMWIPQMHMGGHTHMWLILLKL